MQNENEKLNPLTCDLQVGDVVEVISGGNERAKIMEISGRKLHYLVESEGGNCGWAQRDELRLISRNGKPVEEAEKKFFANVYDNGNGRFLSNDYDSFEEAYENREDISTYIETVEIVRYKKPVTESEPILKATEALEIVSNIFKYKQWHPKSGEVVWCKFLECAVIVSNAKAAQKRAIFVYWEEDFDSSCNIFPVPVSELEPYTGQDKPVIDFGKAGLVLTDGEIVVVTTGDESADFEDFYGLCILQYKYDAILYSKSEPWRDITAEAHPIIEQLKQLME